MTPTKVHRSSETESYSAFRTRLVLETLLPTFLLPPFFTVVLLHLARTWDIPYAGALSTPLSCFVSIPIWFTVRVQFREWKHHREAKRLGARLVPRIRGRWPGNVDVLLRIMKSRNTHYIMDWAKEMMEEAGSTTINTGILWGNQVSVDLFIQHLDTDHE